jgi:hypothetical protein
MGRIRTLDCSRISDDHALEKVLRSLPMAARRQLRRYEPLLAVIAKLHERYAEGLSSIEVTRLAKRWSEALPPSRGRVIQLNDHTQSDLFEVKAKRRRRVRRR